MFKKKTIAYSAEENKWRILKSFSVKDGCFAEVRYEDFNSEFISAEEDANYILPGLIDAHTHLLEDPYAHETQQEYLGVPRNVLAGRVKRNFADALSVGVTSLRDLGGRGYEIIDVLSEVFFDKGVYPRVVTSGCYITKKGGHGSDRGAILLDEARKIDGIIDYLSAKGLMILKVLLGNGVFSQEEIDFIAKRAHARGFLVSAHAYVEEDARLAVNAGVDSLEHVGAYSDKLLIDLKKSGIIVLPTYIAAKDGTPENSSGILEDYNAEIADAWYKAERETIPKLYHHGIRVGLGCDSGFYGTPLNSLIREIECLHRDFSIPIETIMFWAYVITPLVLGKGRRIGKIENGYSADYCIYSKNPLCDLSALHTPKEVFIRGRKVG